MLLSLGTYFNLKDSGSYVFHSLIICMTKGQHLQHAYNPQALLYMSLRTFKVM